MKRRLAPTELGLPISVLLFTVLTDQLTKAAAANILGETGEVRLFGGIAVFSFIRNHDGFLSVARDLPDILQFFFLYVCVAVLLAGCLFALFVRPPPPRYNLPLSLITGGGLSNLADRILHGGGVSDFMMLAVGVVHTGIFNLADVYILVGSFVFGYLYFSGSDS